MPLPDSIPAHVYTQSAAEAAADMAEEVVTFAASKVRTAQPDALDHSTPAGETENQ